MVPLRSAESAESRNDFSAQKVAERGLEKRLCIYAFKAVALCKMRLRTGFMHFGLLAYANLTARPVCHARRRGVSNGYMPFLRIESAMKRLFMPS